MPNLKNTIEDINRKIPIYSALKAIEFTGIHLEKSGKIRKVASFICICGNIKNMVADHVMRGSPKSCGCLIPPPKNKTHGLSRKHKLYKVWGSMKARCYRKTSHNYKKYGGRGIKICDEWMDSSKFIEWGISRWQDGLILDRIDNNGNYEPNNCRFVDALTSVNNRSTTLRIVYNGIELTAMEWAKKLNVNIHTIYSRHSQGLSAELVLSKKRLRTKVIKQFLNNKSNN